MVAAATAAAVGASGTSAAEERFFKQPLATEPLPCKVRTLLLLLSEV
jgi:hypothetical protein